MAINPAGVRWKQYLSTSSATATKPTLTIQGDLMVALCFTDTGTFGPPAGWVQLGSERTVSSGKARVYWKLHGDEAGTTTYVMGSGGTAWQVRMLTFAGVSVAGAIGVVGDWETSSGTSTPSHTSIAYQYPNSMCLAICLHDTSTATYTAPGGYSEVLDANGATGDYKDDAGNMSSGVVQWTASASSTYYSMLIEIVESTVSRRLYLDSAASAPLAPSTWCAQWDLNMGSALTRRLNDERGSSAQSWRTYVDASSSNNQDSALARFVVMLGTGYIEGSFLAVLQCYESSTSANDFSQISIKIIQPSGADRTVLFAGQTSTATSGSEFSSTTQAAATNRYFPKATLSRAMTPAYYYQGDALVVEVGYRQNSTGTTYTGGMYIGEPSGTDLTDQNETATADDTPWIEFAWGLTLSGEGPDVRDRSGPYLRRIE